MRNLSFFRKKCDKRYLLAFIITFLCAMLCGIILQKQVTSNNYLRKLVSDYVYRVFNFKCWPLMLSHILGDILYFYIFFLICYFTKFKYICLAFLFLRGIFFGFYVVLMFGLSSIGGIIVAIFVFIPATLISVAVCFVLSEFCVKGCNKNVLFLPAILAVADCIVMLLLVNVLFRVVIIIV